MVIESLLRHYVDHTAFEIVPVTLPGNRAVCLHRSTKCILIEEVDYPFLKKSIPDDFICAVSPIPLSRVKSGPFIDAVDFFSHLRSSEDKLRFLERFQGSAEELLSLMELM